MNEKITETIRESRKKHYAKNKDEISRKSREYYHKNKERVNAKAKERREKLKRENPTKKGRTKYQETESHKNYVKLTSYAYARRHYIGYKAKKRIPLTDDYVGPVNNRNPFE